jgi:uncharacterized Zn finger protein (UPF0148 family)
MTCTSCGQSLIGKPKIKVEGIIYCFRCSKQQVADKYVARKNAAEAQHKRELSVYFGEKTKFDNIHRDWSRKRSEFIRADTYSWTAGLIGTAIFYFVGEDEKVERADWGRA